MAGRGGLNLTHSESLANGLLDRYGPSRGDLAIAIEAFAPASLTQWAEGLGRRLSSAEWPHLSRNDEGVAVGARVASARLDGLQASRLHMRHRWVGFGDETGAPRFDAAGRRRSRSKPNATILALGGASWPRLGSDGNWTLFSSTWRHHHPAAGFQRRRVHFVVG